MIRLLNHRSAQVKRSINKSLFRYNCTRSIKWSLLDISDLMSRESGIRIMDDNKLHFLWADHDLFFGMILCEFDCYSNQIIYYTTDSDLIIADDQDPLEDLQLLLSTLKLLAKAPTEVYVTFISHGDKVDLYTLTDDLLFDNMDDFHSFRTYDTFKFMMANYLNVSMKYNEDLVSHKDYYSWVVRISNF